jgi:hypothetical protein
MAYLREGWGDAQARFGRERAMVDRRPAGEDI